MTISFWLTLIIVGLLVYVIPIILSEDKETPVDEETITPTVKEEPEPKLTTVSFMGGPLDAKTLDVDSTVDWFVATYIPEDEEDREPVGFIEGVTFFRPQLAYYRQVTETTYFYVRDISAMEYHESITTKVAPKVENGTT